MIPSTKTRDSYVGKMAIVCSIPWTCSRDDSTGRPIDLPNGEPVLILEESVKWDGITRITVGNGNCLVLLCGTEGIHAGKRVNIDRDCLFVTTRQITERMAGKKICITGTLKHPREFYLSMIKLCGGEYKKSVTKDLDFLVCERTDTTKAKAAQKNKNCTVIDEEGLLHLAGVRSWQNFVI